MYLKNSLILNDGPIVDFEFEASFNMDGSPKPTILVGVNGSGKTNFLSILTDSFVELASSEFGDIRPVKGLNQPYYRLLGGSNQRNGTDYSVCALRFDHHGSQFFYRSKSGSLNSGTVKDRMSIYGKMSEWSEGENVKNIGDINGVIHAIGKKNNDIMQIFLNGCYASFPVNRHEIPHWLNRGFSDEEENDFRFEYTVQNNLNKNIIVDRAIDKIKPWILDIFLDQSTELANYLARLIDKSKVKDENSLTIEDDDLSVALQKQNATMANINTILQKILNQEDVNIVRGFRNFKSQRLRISSIDGGVVPSLDHLSSGQSTLFSIFSTILRYVDMDNPTASSDLQNIEGIVLIDEVDAHLHTDLQFHALPKLIRLFPKVQFIISAHSPIFLLGMDNEFGNDGFEILEMPDGKKIEVESFIEVKNSFDHYKKTKLFEKEIIEKVEKGDKPLILTEGETDVKYLKAAFEIFGYEELLSRCEIQWVGVNTNKGAEFGGQSSLDKVYSVFKHKPALTKNRKIFLLYDCDTKKVDKLNHSPFQIVLPQNKNSRAKNGIENMFDRSVLEDRFYERSSREKNDGGATIDLNKRKLCDFLCGEGKTEENFEKFRPIIEEISRRLITEDIAETEDPSK